MGLWAYSERPDTSQRESSQMQSARSVVARAALCTLLCTSAGDIGAQPTPEAAAEALVRQVWFEGLPLDRAAALGPAAGARLAGMLADPAEAAHHANVVMALGVCDCRSSFEVLARFSALLTSGADPHHARAARLAVPHAMGLLARRDARALAWLESRAATLTPGPGDPAVRSRHTAVIQGLSLSRSPRATTLLGEVEAAASARGDTAMARRAAQARARAEAGPQY